MKRQEPIRRISQRRLSQRLRYAEFRTEWLSSSPFCQIYIFVHGLDEARVFAANGRLDGHLVPRATTLHHRNKAVGDRLCDPRWVMSACLEWHEKVENRKGWARELGLLLPIQADADGRWGDGNQALTTREMMASTSNT